MKSILILGMPRSGTSLVAEILQNLGLDFQLNGDNSLDNIYKNSTHASFYQSKSLHLHLMSKGIKNFLPYPNVNIDSQFFNVPVLKEPYLLGVLENIRQYIDKIVLVIRSPSDVILSCNKFYRENGSTENLSIKTWNSYYSTFIKTVGDLPFHVVNYDLLIAKPDETIKSLCLFLSVPLRQIDVIFKKKESSTLLNLDVESMFLYKNLTLQIDSKTLKGQLEFIKEGKNCFCGLGKKYKKCCRFYRAV